MYPPISVILTGGTICCQTKENGTRYSNAEKTGFLLLEQYKKENGDAQGFLTQMPMNTLSEDLQPAHWDLLLDALRQVNTTACSGVIIAHGTDSLAETAAMLACALAGYPLPVVLVSAHTPPEHPKTNAHRNFAAAVELLQNGLPAGVWVVYENLDGVVYLHHGAKLRLCANESDEFFSRDMQPCQNVHVEQLQPAPWQEPIPLIQMASMADAPPVLQLRPYIGLRYDRISMEDAAAVVHGTYHSETANSCDGSPYSLRYLLRRTKAAGIPCFLAPCAKYTQQYASAEALVAEGITPLPDASLQLAYGAAMVASAMGCSGEALCSMVQTFCQRFER